MKAHFHQVQALMRLFQKTGYSIHEIGKQHVRLGATPDVYGTSVQVWLMDRTVPDAKKLVLYLENLNEEVD